MTLRQLPGATVLGLVAALIAHAALFGGAHAWGGAYHSALLELTLAAAVGLTAAANALLWSGARCAADGTVLAARIRHLLPGWPALAGAGAAWFFLGECIEPAHAAAPMVATVAVLALAALLVLRLAAAALGLLASFVFAIASGLTRHAERFEVQLPISAPLRQAQHDSAWWCARFLRPPPVSANA